MAQERFQAPTESDVLNYSLSLGYRINAAKFLAYYEARGWMMGKTPIKSWKACIKTWKIRSQEDGGQGIFQPIPKESEEARKERLIKAKRCLYCTTGIIEFDKDMNKWRCKMCNIDHTEIWERYRGHNGISKDRNAA